MEEKKNYKFKWITKENDSSLERLIEEGRLKELKKLSDLTKKGLKTSRYRTNLSKMYKIRVSSRMVESKISTQTSKKE